MFTDKEIGKKIRKFRTLSNLTQEKLAERIGISYQQLQRYEKGAHNISTLRLQQIATALKIPVELFFSHHSAEEKFDGVAEMGTEYLPLKPINIEGLSGKETEAYLMVALQKLRSLEYKQTLLKQLLYLLKLERTN